MQLFLFSLLGLTFGSFANVCILRLPKEQSLLRPPSRCPHCDVRIRWRDNIPVLGYLLLKGRCHSCRRHISIQYPIIEGVMGLTFAGIAWFSPDLFTTLFACILAFFWLTTTIIDIRHRILPDELTLGLLLLGWSIAWWNPFLGDTGVHRLLVSIPASLVAGGVMLTLAWAGEKIFKKEALGGGDIKLLAACGAVLGWNGVISTLFFGSVLGGLFGIGMMAIGKKKWGETIPFGPFLNAGMAIGFFYPRLWQALFFVNP